jgi:hypothetical protein
LPVCFLRFWYAIRYSRRTLVSSKRRVWSGVYLDNTIVYFAIRAYGVDTMSVERDEQAFAEYLRYQEAQRPHRIETLGGSATAIVLSTIDLGISEVADPSTEHRRQPLHAEAEASAEVVDLRSRREHKLAEFAADNVELGYARAA